MELESPWRPIEIGSHDHARASEVELEV